jgi:opacity protein-like surface antigen
MKRLFLLATLSAAVAASPTFAHHGEEFFTLHSHGSSHAGDGYFHGDYGWDDYKSGDEMDATFGFYYSLLAHIGLSLDARFEDGAEDSWDYQALMPMVHIHLTDHESNFPLKIGAAIGYQFAKSGGEHHEEAEEDGHMMMMEESHPHNSGHSGIHNHDEDLWMGRLSVSTMIGETKLVANLITVVPDGGDADFGYGIGLRRKVCEKVSLSLEAQGDFDTEGYHEVLGGVYYAVTDKLTFRFGAGAGLTDQSPDAIIRTGLIWKF